MSSPLLKVFLGFLMPGEHSPQDSKQEPMSIGCVLEEFCIMETVTMGIKNLKSLTITVAFVM